MINLYMPCALRKCPRVALLSTTLISYFADFEQVKKLTAKLPWEKPDTYAL